MTVVVGLAGLVVTLLVVAAMILAAPGNVDPAARAVRNAHEDDDDEAGAGGSPNAAALTPVPAARSRA